VAHPGFSGLSLHPDKTRFVDFRTATQGSSGKTAATQVSYFFVQNPIMATESGAGLIRRLDETIRKGEPLPTILYDEVQNVFGPTVNTPIYALLNSYIRGFPRTVYDDGGWIKLDLFCPVIMNGLTTKYDMDPNFLERCIQTKLRKKLASEPVEDFDFIDLLEEIGETYRIPRVDWAKNFRKEDIKGNRQKITEHLKSQGIGSRDLQLWRPLVEYAYLSGDDTFEAAIGSARHYLEKPDIQLTLREQLISDIHEVFDRTKAFFLYSEDLCRHLNQMLDSPWHSYNGRELNANNLAFLVRDYGIGPSKDDTGSKRGYYLRAFADAWLRILGLQMPEHAKGY
jgi:Protein of unknown function (DUF3631)